MGRFLSTVAQASALPLLLDDDRYSERLLAGGATPWLDAAAFVAHRRKAIGLLRPDGVSVPIGKIADAWLVHDQALKSAASIARRTTGPLKVLLGDEGFGRHVATLVQGLASVLPSLPLILILPSLADWIVRAAPERVLQVCDDDIDAASVYVAEFLRRFAEIRVDAIVMDERSGTVASDLVAPILNVAAHYGWDVGLFRDGEAAPRPAGTFLIGPECSVTAGDGVFLPPSFWSGEGSVPRSAAFLFAVVPEDEIPERVLQRLSQLRA